MAAPIKPLDYEPIAPTYNDRYRANRLSGVESALKSFQQKNPPGRILEVGCGTGRWISSLSNQVRGVFGLDLSTGMLAQAQTANPKLNLTQGQAGKLPYPDLSFQMILCVNALHHFSHPQDFITESWEILKPDGTLIIIGQIPQDRRNNWYVYKYFEGTFETDLKRFHTWETVSGWMTLAGFVDIHCETVEQIIKPQVGREVLNDPFLKKKAVSQLALLSDQDYQKGMRRIKTAIETAEARGETLIFPTDLSLEMLIGFKKSSAG
jgi:ubiquinone/menaquinone biosynthesis C-methylase UbiE